MRSHLLLLWLRLRIWLAKRLGLWRGRWQRAELEANVARWGWWPWPFGARRWHYAIYGPPALADGEPAPLVVLLHGCRQRAIEFAQASGWVDAASRGRFRLLCPEQRDGANLHRCWNWFLPAAQAGRGELDVVLKAIDEAGARFACTGIAAVGLSAGGALAALLAFHHAERFGAVVAVAAPPLVGTASLQDPRQVMRAGLAVAPTLVTLLLRQCAPLLVLHGADDEVVSPRCAEQLTEQARSVMTRTVGPLLERELDDGAEYASDERVLLRRRLLAGLGHVWSGGPGGHDYVVDGGPPLTAIAVDFLHSAGVLQPA